MGLRSLYGQKRLGLKIVASGKAVDSRPTGDLKTREIEHGISRTKDTFAPCKCSLPLSRRKDHRFFTSRIDTSVFADQPEAGRREALKALAWPRREARRYHERTGAGK